jgi:Zn-finger nucleic acid-binding protein
MTGCSGIEIDYFPDCRGFWLDRRELEKIIKRSSQNVKYIQTDIYSERQ